MKRFSLFAVLMLCAGCVSLSMQEPVTTAEQYPPKAEQTAAVPTVQTARPATGAPPTLHGLAAIGTETPYEIPVHPVFSNEDSKMAHSLYAAKKANIGIHGWRLYDFAHLSHELQREDSALGDPAARAAALAALRARALPDVIAFLEKASASRPTAEQPMIWRFQAALVDLQNQGEAGDLYKRAAEAAPDVPAHQVRYAFDMGEGGKAQAAGKMLIQSAADAVIIGDSQAQVLALAGLGQFSKVQEMIKKTGPDQSRKFFDAAIEATDDRVSLYLVADIFYSRGMAALWKKGEDGSEYFRNAAKLYNGLGNERRSAWSNYHLSAYTARKGDLDEAIGQLIEARRIFIDLDVALGLARTEVRLASIYRKQKDLERAEAHYRSGGDAATRVQQQMQVANIYIAVSRFMASIGKDEEAKRWHDRFLRRP